MVDMTLNDLYAKVKVIHLVLIDSSYTTLYSLSIVTFALGRQVLLLSHFFRQIRSSKEHTMAISVASALVLSRLDYANFTVRLFREACDSSF